MEEKNSAIQQTNKLRQEVVRSYDAVFIAYAVCLFISSFMHILVRVQYILESAFWAWIYSWNWTTYLSFLCYPLIVRDFH